MAYIPSYPSGPAIPSFLDSLSKSLSHRPILPTHSPRAFDLTAQRQKAPVWPRARLRVQPGRRRRVHWRLGLRVEIDAVAVVLAGSGFHATVRLVVSQLALGVAEVELGRFGACDESPISAHGEK